VFVVEGNLEWCKLWNLKTIPVLYEGVYAKDKILQSFEAYQKKSTYPVEGFVVRLAQGFAFDDFKKSVAKFVNDTFVITTTKHWKYDVKELNQLKNNRNVWEIIS
jgi:hypothetical protein